MTYEELISKAREIKTETSDRANTAQRVGGWMEEALTYLQSSLSVKANSESSTLLTSAKTLVGAINELASNPNLDGSRVDTILLAMDAMTTALNAKADLVGGVVPSSQLPSYVDEVIEVNNYADLPGTGSGAKIYITKDTNKTYRWGGSDYVEIARSIALGETEMTAYRGDRGKAAYDHAQKRTGNPHNVTASQIGLGNVDNTSDLDKPISTAVAVVVSNLSGLIADLTLSLSGKVGKSDIKGWTMPSYNAQHAGDNDYVKILTASDSVPLSINARKVVFGTTSSNTIVLTAAGDASLVTLLDWGLYATIDTSTHIMTLYAKALKYSTPAVPTYVFHVASGSGVELHTNTFADLSARKVYAANVVKTNISLPDTGAISFALSHGVASVSLADSSDFIGTTNGANRATVKASNASEGKMYRFTFDKRLEGGFCVKNGNGSTTYIDITDPIEAGDVVILTSVSNTSHGWTASYTRASVKSSDGSVKVTMSEGVADLHVEHPSLPTLAEVATSGSSEDLTDTGYGLQTGVIPNASGEIVGGSGYFNLGVKALKNGVLLTKEAFNDWVRKYKPGRKEKSYGIIDDSPMRIIDSVDAVEVKVDMDSGGDENARIKVYLPIDPPHLYRVEIYCSRARIDGQPTSVQIWRMASSQRSLEYISEMQMIVMEYNATRNSWSYCKHWYASDGQETE